MSIDCTCIYGKMVCETEVKIPFLGPTHICTKTKSLFLHRVLTENLVACYVHLVTPLTPLTLATTLASLASSVPRLAHSLRLLPRGMVKSHKYVFTLKTLFLFHSYYYLGRLLSDMLYN